MTDVQTSLRSAELTPKQRQAIATCAAYWLQENRIAETFNFRTTLYETKPKLLASSFVDKISVAKPHLAAFGSEPSSARSSLDSSFSSDYSSSSLNEDPGAMPVSASFVPARVRKEPHARKAPLSHTKTKSAFEKSGFQPVKIRHGSYSSSRATSAAPSVQNSRLGSRQLSSESLFSLGSVIIPQTARQPSAHAHTRSSDALGRTSATSKVAADERKSKSRAPPGVAVEVLLAPLLVKFMEKVKLFLAKSDTLFS
jgi:hypothetical protein